MPTNPAAKPSPEFTSLASTRACLQASIADRERDKHPTPDARAVTASERDRLAEVEARMKEIDPEGLADLVKKEAAPAPSEASPAPSKK